MEIIYNDRLVSITPHIPLSDRGGGGLGLVFSANPPPFPAPEIFH